MEQIGTIIFSKSKEKSAKNYLWKNPCVSSHHMGGFSKEIGILIVLNSIDMYISKNIIMWVCLKIVYP